MLDELFQDFRISVRGLLRTPLFAVTGIWRWLWIRPQHGSSILFRPTKIKCGLGRAA